MFKTFCFVIVVCAKKYIICTSVSQQKGLYRPYMRALSADRDLVNPPRLMNTNSI